MPRRSSPVNLSNTPPPLIIISGLPRSGTTWLGKLFDSHPRVLYRHEPDTVYPLKWLPTVISESEAHDAAPLRAYVARIPHLRDAKVAASQPVFGKAYFSPLQRLFSEHALRAVKLGSALGGKVQTPRFCMPPAHQDYVLVWKTIESAGRLGFFLRALPPLRIIHIVRHPGGTVSSQLRGKRLNKFEGYDQAADFEYFKLWIKGANEAQRAQTLAHIHTMNEVERLAWLNLVRMEKTLRDLEHRAECRIVVYEKLCARPAEILKELFEFCGLNFSAQTQKFLSASTSKTDERYFGIFKNSMAATHKWKTELDHDARRAVLRMLAQSPLARFWAEEL